MFDFRLKHGGEPPARLVASVRLGLKERGFSAKLADSLAPVMESVDDLEEILSALAAMQSMVDLHKVDEAEGLAAIVASLEEHIAAANETGADAEEGEDEDDPTPAQARQRRSMRMGGQTLTRRLYKKLTYRGPKVRIDGRGPSVSRMRDPFDMRVAAVDYIQARINPGHKLTWGARFMGASFADLAMTLETEAGRRHSNPQRALGAVMSSHTTSDFPGIVADGLNKELARRLEQAPPALTRAARQIPAKNYHTGRLLGLSASGMPQEVGESGEIKHVTVSETGEALPVMRDYASGFRITERTLRQDDAGVLQGLVNSFHLGAQERLRHTLLEPLQANAGAGVTMSDGRPTFHADHGNLAASGGALSVETLGAARVALRGQRGAQGEYLSIEPWALVVPPALETAAQQVLTEISAVKTADVNPFGGQLELIVEAGLTSQIAWYLIGNPGVSEGLAYSFFEDQPGPRLESEHDWNTIGLKFRLIWPMAATFVSWRSWYKNPGA